MQTKTSCNNQIDYSKIMGDRVLPFVFTLNLEDSILYPEEGEYQTFCYDIEGVGQDTSTYADLSHFLLGICDEIQADDILEITVVRNGQQQTVIWGENVEIKTPEKPDNPTGCTGLKFDFSLDKVDGTMEVCIVLAEPYSIGPVNVCIFGGNTTATGLMICGPVCGGAEPCDSVFYQKETVCVPVTVTPFANPGTIRTTCCGDPIVRTGTDSACQGSRTSCSFTITQSLCIEIPISFGAVVETGDAVVQCGGVSEEECDCSDDSLAEVVPTTTVNQEMNDRRFFTRSRI